MSSASPAITNAAIEDLRRRIGIPVKWGDRPRNTYSSVDSIREFAFGYGDDNPLFTDPEYAAGTRWGALLAPPLYFISTGIGGRANWTDEQAEAMSGGDPLRGVGQYMSSDRWAFIRPVIPGIRLWRSQYLDSVEVRDSDFGGGRVAVLTHRVVYTDDADQIFAVNERVYHHAERKTSGGKGKYREVRLEPYSDEQLEAIYAAYEEESRRGPDQLTINKVVEGDELPQIVKGPLTVTDIICHHVAAGWGAMAGGPLKLAYRNRKRIPGFYTKNALNVYDVAQRCHWEAEFAQELGQPAAYDYGAMRTNWVAHLITNWMGDDAWISRLSTRVRRFNYVGDTQWLTGSVERVDADADPPQVELTVAVVNQRGETTCQGRATVLVAGTDGQPPELPRVATIENLPARL
jgi:acyl dehydratase